MLNENGKLLTRLEDIHAHQPITEVITAKSILQPSKSMPHSILQALKHLSLSTTIREKKEFKEKLDFLQDCDRWWFKDGTFLTVSPQISSFIQSMVYIMV